MRLVETSAFIHENNSPLHIFDEKLIWMWTVIYIWYSVQISAYILSNNITSNLTLCQTRESKCQIVTIPRFHTKFLHKKHLQWQIFLMPRHFENVFLHLNCKKIPIKQQYCNRSIDFHVWIIIHQIASCQNWHSNGTVALLISSVVLFSTLTFIPKMAET